MEGGAPPDRGEYTGQRLLVIDEKIAGGGAYEHLDAGGARQPLKLGEIVDIVAGGADEEGEVAMHAIGRGGDLGGQGLGARCRGLGVRHLEHGRDAAQDRRPAAGLKIFLVLDAGLAEMHLGIDNAGQHMKAARVDGLARERSADIADRAIRPSRMPISASPSPS